MDALHAETMTPLLEPIAERVSAVLASTPDADPVGVAALVVAESELAALLHARFAAFGEGTRDLLVAHGDWAAFDRDAAKVADLSDEAVGLALVELSEAGWLTPDRQFPMGIRGWRRAQLEPSADMVERAARSAEAAFHRLRCAGAGDRAARAALEHWCRWSSAPEVAQWLAIFREEELGDAVCERCAAWAAIEQSRAAQWRGWEDQARRWLDRAEAAAMSDRARFFVRFLRAIRSVQAGDSQAASRVAALMADVPAEEEWHFVHQTQAVLAQAQRRDARPHLQKGIGLAHRLSMPFRELHLRVLLAVAEWPDGSRMRKELELIDALDGSQIRLSDRDRWNLEWTWARAFLASGDLQQAAQRSRTILEDDALVSLNPGAPWAVVALAEREAGREEPARQALIQARRFLTRDDAGEIRQWLEEAWQDEGPPGLPDLVMARPPTAGWVLRDGTRFVVGDEEVQLERSPVSVAMLRALANGPCDTDTLIEACWPGDASSYPSLKNRLHSALRALRKRGLEGHLVFEDDTYRLEGLEVRDAVDPGFG